MGVNIERGKTEDNSWVSFLCDSGIGPTVDFCQEIKGRGCQINQFMD